MNSNNNKHDHMKEIIGGIGAGTMQVIVGYPFDTFKVRYIESNAKSIKSCLQLMIKDNGLKSFYQGIKSPLLGSAFYNANMFYSYSLFDKYISKKEKSIFHNAAISGALVGVTTTFIESPMDLAKTQMQIDKKLTLTHILKNTNLKTFYRGFWPTMIRNIPASGLYFGIYDHLYNYYKTIDRPLYGSLVAGAMAGFMCWSTTYPLDNIKTRIQGDCLKNPKYKGMVECIKKTSFKSMFSGFIPCMVRAVPVNAFVFFGYEYSKKLLD